ncbi:MAG TPA: response regulator [Thermoanaerobaculia bacterium]
MPGKVLVVDDDPAVVLSLRAALGERGVIVESAADATGAAVLLDTHTFCGLVLDLVLNDSSGFDVLRDLERRKVLLPTIVITEKLPSYIREMLSEDQVKLVFPKPVDTRLVASVVFGLCGM